MFTVFSDKFPDRLTFNFVSTHFLGLLEMQAPYPFGFFSFNNFGLSDHDKQMPVMTERYINYDGHRSPSNLKSPQHV